MKKTLILAITIIMTAFLLISCTEADDGKVLVGLGQFGEHPSLDNCRLGFIEGMKEAGFVEGENVIYDYKNASFAGDSAVLIAKDFVTEECDLICAIATPMAQAAYNNAYESGIPVVFTAITDPVIANLVEGNVTGTSDMLPVEAQLQLIRAMMPEATKIGILYTTSEDNSISTLATYKALAGEYGFEIVEKGITVSADIPMAVEGLLTEVDCLSNLTDNTVVGSLGVIIDRANNAGVPVFGSEETQMQAGCIAGEGLDYFDLGKQTGAIAARILNGESASDIDYQIIEESYLYINSKAAQGLGIDIPAELEERAIFVNED